MIPIQRQWLLSKLSTAYLMSAFTLDPSAFDAVRRLTTGQRLYLDTNRLFPLMHLHGRRRYEETREAIERSRLQGYEICVTRWTLKEWKRSISTARKQLRVAAMGQSPSADGEDDFATAKAILKAHGLHCRDTHEVLTPDEFCKELVQDIRYRLKLEGVNIVEEGCDWVDRQTDQIEAHVAELRRFRTAEEEKALPVQEHDAKIRSLIERFRGETDRSLSNAGYLFITDDQSLVRWASYPDPDATPFAVTADMWLRRLRHLQPRVKDYDETLALLLDTPALHVPDILTHEQVMKVILQISAHEQSTPEIDVQRLLDAPLVSDDELEADELNRYAYGDREAGLLAKLDTAEQTIIMLEGVRQTLETRLNESATEVMRGFQRAKEHFFRTLPVVAGLVGIVVFGAAVPSHAPRDFFDIAVPLIPVLFLALLGAGVLSARSKPPPRATYITIENHDPSMRAAVKTDRQMTTSVTVLYSLIALAVLVAGELTSVDVLLGTAQSADPRPAAAAIAFAFFALAAVALSSAPRALDGD